MSGAPQEAQSTSKPHGQQEGSGLCNSYYDGNSAAKDNLVNRY